MLTPSPYLISTNLTYNRGFLEQDILEAKRLAPSKPVYYYMWYRYLHTGWVTAFPVSDRPCGGKTINPNGHGDYIPSCLLTAAEVEMSIAVPKAAGAAGVVIWGGGGDQGTRRLCESFYTYFREELGPAVARGLGRGAR